MDDLIWSIRDAKTSLTTLLQRGQIGDDLWERFLLAEKELEAEIVEVVGEANTFEPGYGQKIFNIASDMVSHERWKEVYKDTNKKREEENAKLASGLPPSAVLAPNSYLTPSSLTLAPSNPLPAAGTTPAPTAASTLVDASTPAPASPAQAPIEKTDLTSAPPSRDATPAPAPVVADAEEAVALAGKGTPAKPKQQVNGSEATKEEQVNGAASPAGPPAAAGGTPKSTPKPTPNKKKGKRKPPVKEKLAQVGPGDETSSTDHSVLMDQIIMFGDSITQGAWVPGGTGATISHAYQRKLSLLRVIRRAERLIWKACSDVINRGFSAVWGLEVLKQWLPRKDERLPKIRIFFVWFGANDACLPPSPQAVTLEEFKKNLNTIMDLLRSPSSPHYSPSTQIVLITPPPVDAEIRNAELASRDPPRVPDRDRKHTQAFAEAVKEVARDAKVPSVDVWTKITATAEQQDGGKLDRYLSDGLHLTAEGYRLVTEELAEVIIRQLPHLHWDRLEQRFPHWADFLTPEQRF
ncbi:LOW QUALITY PROTEIN: GDSL Lipase/Acylhydrolase [Rhodotorula toruloides]|nr:LOW QUALITY PROTEIN: GDSL Lipase/Acylhydrolase [Rhodotorula toruloides]